jgi:hypothetical protein
MASSAAASTLSVLPLFWIRSVHSVTCRVRASSSNRGLPLIAVDASDEDEDLEGHGSAQYDPTNRWWVVEFDEQGVRHVPAGDRTPVRAFLCVRCRVDLQVPLEAKGLTVSGTCPSCGTHLLAPFNPPAPA